MNNKNPCIPDQLPVNLNWQELAGPIEQANLAVGRFDGALATMINSNILLSSLTTNEAVLSSRIEGTQVSLTEAFEHHEDEQKFTKHSQSIKEVKNYRTALNNATNILDNGEYHIGFTLIRNLHKNLMLLVRGDDKNTGQFRTKQNWIGKQGDPIEKARFVPPSPIIMKDCLENWKKFINQDYQSPLVQLALIHAQFEIIHPFDDGNGRLGRMIIPLFMYQKKILNRPTFYISDYISDHDSEYRDRLLAITEEGDWMGWVLFFLKAVTEQAKINQKKSLEIYKLYEGMKEKFRKATHSQFAQSALDAFFKNPIMSSTDFRNKTNIPSRPTATNILGSLCREELIDLHRKGAGQNPSMYRFSKLIKIVAGTE